MMGNKLNKGKEHDAYLPNMPKIYKEKNKEMEQKLIWPHLGRQKTSIGLHKKCSTTNDNTWKIKKPSI